MLDMDTHSEAWLFFQLMYALFAFCVIYPPKEFINSGITVERFWLAIFSIPSENQRFVQFHISRTCLNILTHSFLPIIYMILYQWNFESDSYKFDSILWSLIWWMAAVAPPLTYAMLMYWWLWEAHPFINDMRRYSNREQSVYQVATNIDEEYARWEKIVTTTSTITKVVATENWVMKTTPYTVKIAHQSDTALILDRSDTHRISQDRSESIQFVNILVKPTRPGVKSFHIRLNALDFADLQDRVNRPITILSGVNFSRNVIEQFAEVFKQHIRTNRVYETTQELDTCFACMAVTPNVKLQKSCADVDAKGNPLPAETKCGNCFCRPMWCDDCMAKWFASKQTAHAKNIWLQQKCSCPMCRAKFCMLDVCPVIQLPGNGERVIDA